MSFVTVELSKGIGILSESTERCQVMVLDTQHARQQLVSLPAQLMMEALLYHHNHNHNNHNHGNSSIK